ncbi:MAG TPA: hypothetical protein VNA19_06895 [Pyrinomonadaceae bacterium]|jgi:hypothetical protein|nr:hypothetical protein [Pyrinomonadaceae bacterium]
MKNQKYFRATSRSAKVVMVALALAVVAGLAQGTRAANWNSIEPLKSRRGDVERALGKPLEDKPGETGTLRFKVAGGTVTVSFVNARFVANKKLSPDLEGTVLQVVLQHERAPDTPESLGLAKNSDFEREQRANVSHFRNQKDGISYTFVEGKLTTTWYSPAADQLLRARIKA